MSPSPNGANGRDPRGRFATGNRGGSGNPYAKRTAALRGLLLDCVTDRDLRAILAAIVKKAKGGDLAAAREILDRLIGKPKSTIEIEQRALSEAQIDTELNYALRQLADGNQTTIARTGNGKT